MERLISLDANTLEFLCDRLETLQIASANYLNLRNIKLRFLVLS
jgi:hypothetical protein